MAGIGALQNNALNSLLDNQYNLLKTGQQLSSGLKINSAADNPSGLAIYESLTAQASGTDQGTSNVTDALNAIGVSPRDLIAIVQALKQAGSLDAVVEMQ